MRWSPAASRRGPRRCARLSPGSAAIVADPTVAVDADLLDAAGPGLRVVANFAVGHDNVDLDACRGRGIVVTNTPDVLTNATAELALALALAAARHLPIDRARPAGGGLGRLGPGRPPGAGAERLHRRHRRPGPDRAPLRRAPGGVRGRASLLVPDAQARGCGGTGGGAGRSGRPARPLRPRQPPRPRDRGDPPPDRRRGAGADEADRRPRQHLARRSGRSRPRWPPRCARIGSVPPALMSSRASRRSRRDSRGAANRAHPAHRLGDIRSPRRHGPRRRGERDRGARGGGAPEPGRLDAVQVPGVLPLVRIGVVTDVRVEPAGFSIDQMERPVVVRDLYRDNRQVRRTVPGLCVRNSGKRGPCRGRRAPRGSLGTTGP